MFESDNQEARITDVSYRKLILVQDCDESRCGSHGKNAVVSLLEDIGWKQYGLVSRMVDPHHFAWRVLSQERLLFPVLRSVTRDRILLAPLPCIYVGLVDPNRPM